jgi:hypothetical protein
MKDQWVMRTEFAWSLRNALIANFPFLEENEEISDEIYMDCVMDYLNLKVKIKLDDRPFELKSIQQIPGDHGHSYTFIIQLEGPVYGTKLFVENNCLTEIYKKQKNEMVLMNHKRTEKTLLTKQDNSYVFVLNG